MNRIMLFSKLHQARITHADLNYEGSFGIDEEIMLTANIHENEQLHICNIENGERFITYAIKAPYGSKIMQANGACARKVAINDRVIICTYVSIEASKIYQHVPTVLFLNARNEFTLKMQHTLELA